MDALPVFLQGFVGFFLVLFVVVIIHDFVRHIKEDHQRINQPDEPSGALV